MEMNHHNIYAMSEVVVYVDLFIITNITNVLSENPVRAHKMWHSLQLKKYQTITGTALKYIHIEEKQEDSYREDKYQIHGSVYLQQRVGIIAWEGRT